MALSHDDLIRLQQETAERYKNDPNWVERENQAARDRKRPARLQEDLEFLRENEPGLAESLAAAPPFPRVDPDQILPRITHAHPNPTEPAGSKFTKPRWFKQGQILPGTILKMMEYRRRPGYEHGYWCRTVCTGICGGETVWVHTQNLIACRYSCGCVRRPRRPIVDLSGKLLGRLMVMEYDTPGHECEWQAVCIGCGNEEFVGSRPGMSYRNALLRAGYRRCEKCGRTAEEIGTQEFQT